MKVEITNLQRRFRISRPALKRLASWLMNKASAMDRSRNWVECSVVITGHDRMIELNEHALRHSGTTDVISFVYETLPGEQPAGCRGEIVINAEEAAEVSGRMRRNINGELALYLAHGCQHLGGADDRTKSEKAAMNRRQNRWLREARKLKLLRGLIK